MIPWCWLCKIARWYLTVPRTVLAPYTHHKSLRGLLSKPFLAALNLTQLLWTQMMFSFSFFNLFLPPICVHDDKTAVTGNGMHVKTHVREEGVECLWLWQVDVGEVHLDNGTAVQQHFPSKRTGCGPYITCALWNLKIILAHVWYHLKGIYTLGTLVCETRDGQIRSELADKLTHHTTSGSQPKPKGKMKADWSGRGWWDIPDDGLMLLSHLFACLLHKIA